MPQAKRSWRITNQINNQTVNDPAGNTLVGSYFVYQTGAGNTGTVFVPDNLRNVEHVKQAVRADAQLVDEIGRLSEEY